MTEQKINVLYLCDRKACGDSSGIISCAECSHTTKIEHARNFVFEESCKVYFEKEFMTVNDYQYMALRTMNKDLTEQELLLDGLMGLNGEAGECIDILKKAIFQDHEFDRDKLIDELGDVAWYLALSAYSLGLNLETVFQGNIDKLKKRYPDGFNSEDSILRDDIEGVEEELYPDGTFDILEDDLEEVIEEVTDEQE